MDPRELEAELARVRAQQPSPERSAAIQALAQQVEALSKRPPAPAPTPTLTPDPQGLQAGRVERATRRAERSFDRGPTVEQIQQASERVLAMPPSPERAKAAQDLKAYTAQVRRALKRDARALAREGAATGRPDLAARASPAALADRLRERDQSGWASIAPEFGPGLSGFGGGLLDTIDIPAAGIRQVATPGHEAFSGRVSNRQFYQALKERADQPGLEAADLVRIPQAVGGALGAPIGAAAGLAAGALEAHNAEREAEPETLRRILDWTPGSGAARTLVGLARQGVKPDALWEATKGGADSGGEFALGVMTDPLSFVGSSLGAGRTAARAASRAYARQAPGKAAQAAQFGEAVQDAIQGAKDTTDAVERARAVFRREGLEPLFEQTFGRGGEFLQSGQLSVGLLPGQAFEVARLTGAEHGGKRALQAGLDAVAGPARRAVGRIGRSGKVGEKVASLARRPVDLLSSEGRLARVQGEEMRRTARSDAAARYAAKADQLRDIASRGPKSKQRQEELVRRELDPYWFEDKAGAVRAVRHGAPPDAAEQAWLDELRGFLRDNELDLIQAGALGRSVQRNPVSGDYYPRAYRSPTGLLTQATWKESRTADGGLPLGAQAVEAPEWAAAARMAADPEKVLRNQDAARHSLHAAAPEDVLAELARSSSGAEAQAVMMRGLAARFGRSASGIAAANPDWVRITVGQSRTPVAVPRRLHEAIEGTFDQQLNSVTNWLSSTGKQPGALTRAAEVVDWLTNSFKSNVLLMAPRFFALNVVNDTTQLALAGVTRIPTRLRQADALLRGDPNIRVGQFSAADLLAGARANGIGLGGLGAQASSSMDETAARLGGQMAARRRRGAARPDVPLRERAAAAPQGVLDTATGPGRALAEWWEDRSKMALFLDRVAKGDNFATAARRSFGALLDYQDRNKVQQVARWVFPFATWATKAPQAVVRGAIRNPGRVGIYGDALEASAGEAEQPPANWQRQLGRAYPLGPTERRIDDAILRSMGRGAPPPDMDVFARTREVEPEAFQLPGSLLSAGLLMGQGQSEAAADALVPFGGMLHPFLRAAFEAGTQLDIGTGRPLELTEQGYGSPAVGAFNRWVAPTVPLLGASAVGLPLSEALYQAHGGSAQYAPMQTFGFHRQPSLSDDRFYGRQWMNLFSPKPTSEILPSQQVADRVRAMGLYDLREDIASVARARERAQNMQALRAQGRTD